MSNIAIPSSVELAQMPSNFLFQLEQAGQIASGLLDERVTNWTEQGMTQRWIAGELGCSPSAVQRRCERLGIKSGDKRGGSRLHQPDAKPAEDPPEIIPDEDVEVVEDETLPSPPSPAGIKFPPSGISEWRDPTQYSVEDLRNVASDLIKRANPDEAKALAKLFFYYAKKAEVKHA